MRRERFVLLFIAAASAACGARAQDAQVPIPPVAPGAGAEPGFGAQAQLGCLGALSGIRTALARSDDEVLRFAPGERGVVESTVIAAQQLAEAGEEDVCLRIAEALSPLVGGAEGDEFEQANALGYATPGIEWPDELQAFITIGELEGEELYGPSDIEGGERVALGQIELGEVVGAATRLGRVTHLIVDSEEGFLGIGSNRRAVPIDLVRWNVEEERLETTVEADSFHDRPIVEEEGGLWVLAEPVEGGRVRDVIAD